jgi:hypothetical protein
MKTKKRALYDDVDRVIRLVIWVSGLAEEVSRTLTCYIDL